MTGKINRSKSNQSKSKNSDNFPPIYSAICFIDIRDSVLYAHALEDNTYGELLSAFHSVVQGVLREIGGLVKMKSEPLLTKHKLKYLFEPRIAGDEAFFCITHNIESDPEYINGKEEEKEQLKTKREQMAVYIALIAVLKIRDRWFLQGPMWKRLEQQKPVIDIAAGIHFGAITESKRTPFKGGPEEPTYEGYSISYAKRVESVSRHGHYSNIAVSSEAYQMLRNTIVGRSMLKQLVFFKPISFTQQALKGIPSTERVYEIEFYTRLKDMGFIDSDEKESNDSTINENEDAVFRGYVNAWKEHRMRKDFWLYNWMIEWLMKSPQIRIDEDTVQLGFDIALIAANSYKDCDRVYLDLAYFALQMGAQGKREKTITDWYYKALKYCEQSLDKNREIDIIYEILVPAYNEYCSQTGANVDLERKLQWTTEAVCSSPLSATSIWQLTITYLQMAKQAKKNTDQYKYYSQCCKKCKDQTLELCPDYINRNRVKELCDQIDKL